MLIKDFRESNMKNMIEVDVVCSRCKNVNTLIVDRISKINICACPACGNIDIERSGKMIPVSAMKQLSELASQTDSYSIYGQPLKDFLDDLSFAQLGLEGEGLELLESLKEQSLLGLYRIKSYYARFRNKGLLNTTDFPNFETFMRWSVKHGYRDWKTLIANDETNMIDTNARWIAGGYSKKTTNPSIEAITNSMMTLENARQQLRFTLESLSKTKSKDADAKFISKKLVDTINYINELQGEIEARM